MVDIFNAILYYQTTFTFQYRNDKGNMVNGCAIKTISGIHSNIIELSTPIVTDYIELAMQHDDIQYSPTIHTIGSEYSFYGNEIDEIDELSKTQLNDSVVKYEVSYEHTFKNNYIIKRGWDYRYNKENKRSRSRTRFIADTIQDGIDLFNSTK